MHTFCVDVLLLPQYVKNQIHTHMYAMNRGVKEKKMEGKESPVSETPQQQKSIKFHSSSVCMTRKIKLHFVRLEVLKAVTIKITII